VTEGEVGVEGRIYRRESRGLEFDRVTFFADAIFAIAMTVIVVDIGRPTLADSADSQEMVDKLGDLGAEVFSFFLSFVVLGGFWRAHHRLFGRLEAVDRRIITLNLAYLAFIAFMPFPTDLLGSYGDNAVAVAIYAVNVAVVAALEVAILARATGQGFFRPQLTPEARAWMLRCSLDPTIVFAASVPLAFLIGPRVAMLSWLLLVPLGWLLGRGRPSSAPDGLD
jgi:uncharacterized membrane protein